MAIGIEGDVARIEAALNTPTLKLLDRKSAVIAAASVVAKVARDAHMTAMDAQYPGYGFAEHKGYSTAAHFAALDRLGPTPIHRRSFMPVIAPRLKFMSIDVLAETAT